jgi:hypothetical protein
MKRSTSVKLFAVLMIGLLVHMPALGQSCTTDSCPNPALTCVDQLLTDAQFNYDFCWSQGDLGYTSLGGGSGDLVSLGRIWQDIAVSSGHSGKRMQLDFYVSISDNANAGSERLGVEIMNTSGQILETVETIWPNDGNHRYQIDTDNYAGQTIRVNFRYYIGMSPGGTDYSIDFCYYFVHSS